MWVSAGSPRLVFRRRFKSEGGAMPRRLGTRSHSARCHGRQDFTWAPAEPAQGLHVCTSNMAGTASQPQQGWFSNTNDVLSRIWNTYSHCFFTPGVHRCGLWAFQWDNNEPDTTASSFCWIQKGQRQGQGKKRQRCKSKTKQKYLECC